MGDEGGFCIYCKLFCNGNNKPRVAGVLTMKPWTLYSRKESLKDHDNPTTCRYHHEAKVAATNFLARVNGDEPDARTAAAGVGIEMKELRKIVESTSTILAMAAKQSIPLRGHRNERLSDTPLSTTSVNSKGELVMAGDPPVISTRETSYHYSKHAILLVILVFNHLPINLLRTLLARHRTRYSVSWLLKYVKN